MFPNPFGIIVILLAELSLEKTSTYLYRPAPKLIRIKMAAIPIDMEIIVSMLRDFLCIIPLREYLISSSLIIGMLIS
jgi:hypothetical protein